MTGKPPTNPSHFTKTNTAQSISLVGSQCQTQQYNNKTKIPPLVHMHLSQEKEHKMAEIPIIVYHIY